MTNKQRQLSNRFIAYRFFTSVFFLGAVWLYFYRLFITDQQVGVLDGLAFGIGIIAEVPSGALADKFGRGRLVKLGLLLFGGGFIVQALSSSFLPFFIGQSILMIGAAFMSGADEALFFSNLKFDRNSKDWRRLVTLGSQIALIGSTLAYIIGGALHSVNPRLPWILTGLGPLLAILIIWPIKDTHELQKRKKLVPELKEYLQDIVIGFKQFRLPKLWIYVPIMITVQGVFYASGWGILRLILLDRFDFSPFFGSVVVATSSLITVAILAYMHKYADRLSEKKVITVISSLALTSLLLSLANIGVWGFFVIFALYAGEHTLHPFMSEVLNNHAPEEQRATVLSVASFIRMLPYIALAPIIGTLNSQGNLHWFLLSWSALILFAILLYLSNKKRDELVKVDFK